jgi:hypothetical protein
MLKCTAGLPRLWVDCRHPARYDCSGRPPLEGEPSMHKLTLVVVLSLLATPAVASRTAEEPGTAPAPAELQRLIEGSWPSFARRIQHQDKLVETPSHLTRFAQALCRREMAGSYECVSLVEYQLPSGAQRSSLLRHHVGRYANGRLSDDILIRETPRPR